MPRKPCPPMVITDSESSSDDEMAVPIPRGRSMPASKKRELAEREKRLSQGTPIDTDYIPIPRGRPMPSSKKRELAERDKSLSQGTPIDTDCIPSQSQRSLTDAELDRLSSLVSNFFLSVDTKKIPIKRVDISKIIPKEYSRKIPNIIDDASSKLGSIFGYKIVELEKKGYYLMLNKLDAAQFAENDEALIKPSLKEDSLTGLQFIVLSCIFMNGEVIQEASLREFLRKFDVDLESHEKHPVFGDVNKLIFQDFVRQSYLEVSLMRDVEPPYKEIRWGERAKLEIDKDKMLKFVCKVYGENVRPEMWTEQWKRTKKGET